MERWTSRPSCSGNAKMRQSFRSALIANVIASASMFIRRCVSSVSGLAMRAMRSRPAGPANRAPAPEEIAGNLRTDVILRRLERGDMFLSAEKERQ